MKRDQAGRYASSTQGPKSVLEKFCSQRSAAFPCVYEIRHAASGGRYIGSTANLRKRVWTHLLALRARRHHSNLLQRAYDVHGEHSIEVVIVQTHAHIGDARHAETVAIAEAMGDPLLFNVDIRARSAEGRRESPKWQAAIRASLEKARTPEAMAKHREKCARSVRVTHSDTGESRTFPTGREAARCIGCQPPQITRSHQKGVAVKGWKVEIAL